ncbi:hypothetical protein [Psychroflexus tropicus]|uniref:hypothetical protein n=1 Tax=Psychroflexus tropicus TaxID=197345 RepID=UPI0012F9AE0D|nr:hypothetical protein [Psychroflexus tropicus]
MLNKFRHKVKAGALQLVVFVTVIIALLLSSFILYVHLNTMYKQDNTLTIEAIKVTDAGFKWMETHEITYRDTLRTQISERESFKVVKKHWGLLDAVSIIGEVQNKGYNKIALVGGISPLAKNFALRLRNQRNPLVLVGNTSLRGELYTSPYGIKAGNIAGLYYENRDLFQGNLNTASTDLGIKNDKINYLKSIRYYYDSNEFMFIDKLQDSIVNSFGKQAIVYYSEDEIYLNNSFIYGQVMIQSESAIVVDQTTNLEDVILIAPRIQIKDGFKGSVQCFSSDQITVERNVQLNYPSTLFINPENAINKNIVPKIIIESNSRIEGSLVYFRNQSQENQYDTNIYVAANSEIKGMVYSEQNLELYGNVRGSVVTDRFITRYKSSVYINHLLNVRISSDDVSSNYVGIPFNQTNSGVSKWVN